MAPLNVFEDDSSDAESARDSGSESSSSSGRSGSVSSHHGAAPTPGRGFGSDGEQEPSSPQSNKGRRSRSPDNSSLSHRSRSGSPASGSPHSQRSKGVASVRSRSSSSGRSRSAGSNQSRRSSPRSSYSGSPAHSDHSQSPAKREVVRKNKSPARTPVHRRSSSPVSSKSGKSPSSRDSRSRSPKSQGSRSSASSRSASPTSPSNKDETSPTKSVNRDGSASPPASPASPRSRAESGDSQRGSDRSRGGSVESRPGSEKSHGGSERSPPASDREGSQRSRPPSEASRDGSVKSTAASQKSHTKNRAASSSPASHRSRPSASPNSSIGSPVQKDHAVDNDASDNEMTKKSEERRRIPSMSGDDSAPGSPKSDADSEKPKKRKAVVSSDEEDSGGENKNATAEALFGDADDISSDEEGNKRALASEEERDEEKEKESDERGESDDEERRTKDKEEEKEEEVAPETRIDVEIPKIVCDIGRDLHFVKLPNFLSVDTRPFSGDTYEDEIDEEETLDEEGRARLKLKVENTIRWREALDGEGNTVKESNARIVRWSDGSMSLHLGAEIFDVHKQPLQGDHNHLFIRQGTGLQGQAVFRTKLTFRPHSTESFTHRKMTLSLADRSQKSSGIKVLSQVGHDPDQHRGEMIKKEEEKLRASLRRESKAKRTRERGTGRSLNTSYLEPDREDGSDDDGAISLNAIKDKYNTKSKNDNKRNIYSSDDDGSDLDARKSRRVDKIRALKDSDEEEEGSHDEGSQASGRATPASDES